MISNSAIQVTSRLEDAISQLMDIEGFGDLIPQVGSNLVYAKNNATNSTDIAALTGRIISTINRPLTCGTIEYGASGYLASVLLEAMKHDDTIRAAINIYVNEFVTRKLVETGLKVVTIPSKIEGEGCPVTRFIEVNHELSDAYIHPGDFGVEPTTTIIGKDPEFLVDIIRKIVK